MTTLPTWAVYVVTFGTPLLTFAGVMLAQWISRRGAVELEPRSRREETMRTLRWAAELSARPDERLANIGVAELSALLESDILADSEKVFAEAALDAVYDDVEAQINQLGGDVEVVQYVTETAGVPADPGHGDASSTSTAREGGRRHG